MATMIEMTGKTVEDALQAALAQLGVSAEDVEVEVLETPSKGLFGIFGGKPAKIQVKLKKKPVAQTVEVKPAETPAPVVEEKISEPTKVEFVEEIKPVETEVEVEVEKISEPIDKEEIINKAKKFLYAVFKEMHVDAEIEVREEITGIILDLSGKNLGVLIGKHGQTLDALQYLTNLAANKRGESERLRFIIDVENYRERREETLYKLAKSVADRAIRTRQDVKLEPMSRHERRIIHTALQNNDRIETHSAGEEPYRYIVVSPKRRGRQ